MGDRSSDRDRTRASTAVTPTALPSIQRYAPKRGCTTPRRVRRAGSSLRCESVRRPGRWTASTVALVQMCSSVGLRSEAVFPNGGPLFMHLILDSSGKPAPAGGRVLAQPALWLVRGTRRARTPRLQRIPKSSSPRCHEQAEDRSGQQELELLRELAR